MVARAIKTNYCLLKRKGAHLCANKKKVDTKLSTPHLVSRGGAAAHSYRYNIQHDRVLNLDRMREKKIDLFLPSPSVSIASHARNSYRLGKYVLCNDGIFFLRS